MFYYPEFDADGKKVLSTRDTEMMMDIAVYNMKKGESKTFTLPEDELAVMLVLGDVTFKFNDEEKHATRGSLFSEGPSTVHVSKGVSVTVTANADSEVLTQSAENDRDFPAKYYAPEDCDSFTSCQGKWEDTAVRDVVTVFDYKNAPYSNMVLGEIQTRPGRWCSYIPHSHIQPEVYYYKYERPEGFGACFIGEDVHMIKDGSVAHFPGGLNHPQVTAPGFPMYTVWMIRHLPNNPWLDRVDDERYMWLNDGQVQKFDREIK